MFKLMSFGNCIHPDDHSKEDNRTCPSPQKIPLFPFPVSPLTLQSRFILTLD